MKQFIVTAAIALLLIANLITLSVCSDMKKEIEVNAETMNLLYRTTILMQNDLQDKLELRIGNLEQSVDTLQFLLQSGINK